MATLATGGTAKLIIDVSLDGPNSDNQYQGKRYVISAIFEAVQSSNNASTAVWGWSP